MSKDTKSYPGFKRFEFYMELLQVSLDKASLSDNPALALYQDNARTTLFMLEALSRVYEKMHNKKTFGNLKDDFKLLEDMLGAVDYHDSFSRQFAADKKIPAAIKRWLKIKTEENLTALNAVLKERKWIGNENKRITKINEHLLEAHWETGKKDTAMVLEVYNKFIHDIVQTYESDGINFNDVEADLHELRRKLRWLSIYPQCFSGLFQLKLVKEAGAAQAKYLTKEILGSPYNKMPLQATKQVILLDANNFYSLSWMIDRLGNLKDNGLKKDLLLDAVRATTRSSDKQATARAAELSGTPKTTVQSILAAAKKETATFFNQKLLEAFVLE